jgi:hypothetical protein
VRSSAGAPPLRLRRARVRSQLSDSPAHLEPVLVAVDCSPS